MDEDLGVDERSTAIELLNKIAYLTNEDLNVTLDSVLPLMTRVSPLSDFNLQDGKDQLKKLLQEQFIELEMLDQEDLSLKKNIQI